MRSYSDVAEELAWATVKPEHAWVLDKLQLAKRLGYAAGPCGTPVPKPGEYVVRPSTNPLGMERGMTMHELTHFTDHLPSGHFWCEKFEGDHFTIDFHWGRFAFAAIGIKKAERFCRWEILTGSQLKRVATNLDDQLLYVLQHYPVANAELIGREVIEIHLRANPDFLYGNTEFIPVYEPETNLERDGYRYIACPEHNGRKGAFIR